MLDENNEYNPRYDQISEYANRLEDEKVELEQQLGDVSSERDALIKFNGDLESKIGDCRDILMQMPFDTPMLSDALVALGYNEDGH